jgi:hypothetical protein
METMVTWCVQSGGNSIQNDVEDAGPLEVVARACPGGFVISNASKSSTCYLALTLLAVSSNIRYDE